MIDKREKPPSTLMGIGGGTTIAGIAAALPEGWLKVCLVIAAPALTVIIGKFWTLGMNMLDDMMRDWELTKAIKNLDEQISLLNQKPYADPSLLADAKSAYNELSRLRFTQPIERLKSQRRRK